MALQQVELRVDGMSCRHCKNAVEKELQGKKGVQNVNVDLERKKVSIDFDPGEISRTELINSINGLGYHVVE